MHRIFILAFVFMSFRMDCTCPMLSAQDRDAKPMPTVAQAMQSFVEAGEVAGGVILVADDKKVLDLQAFGKSNLAESRAMDKDSIFWIASMSKPVTAASVMILVDQGKLSLSDPLSKHLPEMKQLKTKDGKEATITIQHLLTHTSGMAELKGDDAYNSRNLAEAAKKYAQVEVLFEPGTKWQYSQTSINTAARVVEVVSGKPFPLFLEEMIFKPLQMKDTTFYLSSEQAKRLATSYRKGEQGLSPTKFACWLDANPQIAIVCRCQWWSFFDDPDYARFCQMLLRGGEWDGKRILSESSVNAMRTIVTGELTTGFTPGNGWGIGCCVVKEPQGVTADLSPGSFGHGGAYGTQAWVDPIKKRIYILMVQRSNFPNSDASDLRKRFQAEAARASY